MAESAHTRADTVPRCSQRYCGVVQGGTVCHRVRRAAKETLRIHLGSEHCAQLCGCIAPWCELSAIQDRIVVVTRIEARNHPFQKIKVVVVGTHARVSVYSAPAVSALYIYLLRNSHNVWVASQFLEAGPGSPTPSLRWLYGYPRQFGGLPNVRPPFTKQ